MLSALFRSAAELIFMVLGLSTPQSFPPPLPAQKEREYFVLARGGDERAREKLIEHNLRLVSHIVRKYYGSSRNSEDLVSIGSIGLIKAIDSFRPENGARFATYAAKCIQNEILMYFRTQKKLGCEVSIQETIDTDRDGNPLTYMDIIATEDTIADDLDRRMRTERALLLVKTKLDDRERQIIVLRYGLGNAPPQTQRQVADRLGISRSYVSRIEKAALEKLRAGL